ncbi:MAG TPA: hypothetical protein VGQ58_05605 [Candidatus Limnocylindrales bacterium]|nr:hypothetical protein [Candidatus Limnocylindrales bacterium]
MTGVGATHASASGGAIAMKGLSVGSMIARIAAATVRAGRGISTLRPVPRWTTVMTEPWTQALSPM